MENKDCKPWERPWSIDEISKNSENWNLAGDAGLLKHLQQFSQVLLERTHSSEVALNLLLDRMKATAVDISNVTNTFLMLTNTQFVENRVYEDDDEERENIPEAVHQVKSKEEQAAENVAFVKKALTLGISVLDTMFDAVEVPASDSEDEENSESMGRVLLQPRNTYFLQPLPCIIGSKEFISDDTVGLIELLSDNDDNLNMLPSSSSDTSSDVEHEVTEADGSGHRHSFISSDSGNSEPESERSVPFGKNNFFEPTHKFMEVNEEYAPDGAMFGGESPSEVESVSIFSKPTAEIDFASELSAKLGDIPGQKTSITEREPSQSQDADNFFGGGSDLEGSLFGPGSKEIREGGLFDDLDETDRQEEGLWSTSISNQSNSNAVTTAQEKTSSTHSSHIHPKRSVPEKERKKPVGGVSVLGMVSNTAAKISPYIRRPPSSSSESDRNEDVKPQTVVPSIMSISKEIGDEISNLKNTNERNISFIDEQLKNEAFSSRSLFDPDEEDALFLPSSTPKQQTTNVETSQQRVVSSHVKLDTSGNNVTVSSKHTSLARSPKHTSAKRLPSAHGLEFSDSDDDKNLFSSTHSSISSRSSQLHVNNDDVLKTNSTTQKDLLHKASVFDSDYSEDPAFDIFSSSNPVKNSFANKESRSVSIVKTNENDSNTSSDLFGFDESDVPDIFTSKSNIEVPKSKAVILPSQDLSGSQVDDFDDIFSTGKTSSKENLFLFSTQNLDDDFDIFSSLATGNTRKLSRSNLVDSSKSNDRLEENANQELIAQPTDFTESTNTFLPTSYIDKKDNAGFETNRSENDDDITHSKKKETVKYDFNKSLEKPEPPKSLDISKTTNIISNSQFTSKESVKIAPKSISSPSVTTDVQMSGSPSESCSLITTKNLFCEPEKTFVSDENSGTSNSEAFSNGSYRSNVPQIRTHALTKYVSSETAVSFDSPACTSSVLQSSVKERVRIPAKRRPQSRRARIDALKSSVEHVETDVFDTPSFDSKIVSQEAENKYFSGKIFPGEIQETHGDSFPGLDFSSSSFPESEVKYSGADSAKNQTLAGSIFSVDYSDTKPFSPSTDEEDFFGVPSDLPFEYNAKHTSAYKSDVLFGDAPIMSPDIIGKPQESYPKGLHDELPPFLMPTSSFPNLTSSENIFDEINNVKTQKTQDLSNASSFHLPINMIGHDTCSETQKFSAQLSPQISEPDKYEDTGNASRHSSKDECFVSVDNMLPPENKPDSFHIVPKRKVREKTSAENVSKEEANLSSDNYLTSVNKTNTVGSMSDCKPDWMYDQQYTFGTGTDSSFLSSGIGKTPSEDELFKIKEGETDLFASDVSVASVSQLFDDPLFLPQAKQVFSVAASNIPSKQSEIQGDRSCLDSASSSSHTSKYYGSSEDKMQSSLATGKSTSVTVQEAKNKKKAALFLDDEDDDISIFSSSHLAVTDTSQASASPSRKAGSKSWTRAEGSSAKHKSLHQISKGGEEKFEDPLKVTK